MTETEAIRQNYELGVMAGEAREQQRIIALLPAFFKALPNGNLVDNLSAVIKGEK
jgi:hypothetical protein